MIPGKHDAEMYYQAYVVFTVYRLSQFVSDIFWRRLLIGKMLCPAYKLSLQQNIAGDCSI